MRPLPHYDLHACTCTCTCTCGMQSMHVACNPMCAHVSQAPTWSTESSTDGDGTNGDGLSTGALVAIIAIR